MTENPTPDPNMENGSDHDCLEDWNDRDKESRTVIYGESAPGNDMGRGNSPQPGPVRALEGRLVASGNASILSSRTGASTPGSIFTLDAGENISTTGTTPRGDRPTYLRLEKRENPEIQTSFSRPRITCIEFDKEPFVGDIIFHHDDRKGWMKVLMDTGCSPNIICKRIVCDYNLEVTECSDDQTYLIPFHLRTEPATPIRPLGVVQLDFYFPQSPRTRTEEFLVLDSDGDCIIGKKTILNLDLLKLNFRNRVFRLM